jgi:hypothetical protein
MTDKRTELLQRFVDRIEVIMEGDLEVQNVIESLRTDGIRVVGCEISMHVIVEDSKLTPQSDARFLKTLRIVPDVDPK